MELRAGAMGASYIAAGAKTHGDLVATVRVQR